MVGLVDGAVGSTGDELGDTEVAAEVGATDGSTGAELGNMD